MQIYAFLLKLRIFLAFFAKKGAMEKSTGPSLGTDRSTFPALPCGFAPPEATLSYTHETLLFLLYALLSWPFPKGT